MNASQDPDKNNIANESFEEYREKMHPELSDEQKSEKKTGIGMWIRALLGVFIIALYIGMGVLFLINYFDFNEKWTIFRWFVGIILIAYGIFRAYRFYKGIDYKYIQ